MTVSPHAPTEAPAGLSLAGLRIGLVFPQSATDGGVVNAKVISDLLHRVAVLAVCFDNSREGPIDRQKGKRFFHASRCVIAAPLSVLSASNHLCANGVLTRILDDL